MKTPVRAPTTKPRTLAALALVALVPGVARADNKAVCIDASTQGQTLRNAHKLVAARDQLRICAESSCPPAIANACAEWLDGVEKSLPSVVLSAKDGSGHDLFDVIVTVDGKPLADRIDGHAIPLDAGPHVFRFERTDGTTASEQMLVAEGEKNQRVTAVLQNGPPKALATTEHPEPAPTPAPPAKQPFHITPAWVGGVASGTMGVVTLTLGGVGAGALASSAWNKAKNECPTHVGCSSQAISDRNSAANTATVSTASFVVGGVLTAVGVTLLVVQQKAERPSVGLVVSPGALSLVGSF